MSRLVGLALRNAVRNRGRTTLVAVALLVGVCQMVAGQGFINGMIQALIEDAVLTRVGAVQVYRSGYLEAEQEPLRFSLPDDPAFAARLQSLAGARAVSRRIAFDGMLSNGSVSAVFVATAIDARHEYEVCPRRRHLVAPGSSPLAPDDRAGVLVGAALGEGLGARAGATLVASSTGPGGAPNALDVAVRGFLPEGGVMESKAGLVAPLALAQSLLHMEGKVSEYVLHVDDLGRAEAAAAALRAALGPDHEVRTWRDRPEIRQFTSTMGFMMSIAAFLLAVLVVSVIVNSTLMSVFERVREIGTMMAVGVRRRDVTRLFLVEAAAVGLVGSSLGAAAGLGVVRLMSVGIPLPATTLASAIVVHPQIGVGYAAVCVAAATLVAVAAALYPAWRASRLEPAAALRAT